MISKIFVSLPVKDLKKSTEFYQAVGFRFNPQFSDENGSCLVISEHIYVMLLTHAKFQEFTTKSICDAKASVQTGLTLSCDSRAEVDETVRKAVAAGATTPSEPKDYGFMYDYGFDDLDGHNWGLIHMDESAAQK